MRLGSLFGRMLLAAMVLSLILMTAAMADTNDYTFELNSTGDGYVVTGYSGKDSSITVPDWYNNLPVTEVGSGAFQGNATLKSVSLPSTVVRIGQAAFKNCTSLSTITAYTAAEPPVPDRIPGDADDNGAVDIHDALRVLQYDAGWDVSVNQKNADVNASGGVDHDDALLILQYAVGGDITLK